MYECADFNIICLLQLVSDSILVLIRLALKRYHFLKENHFKVIAKLPIDYTDTPKFHSTFSYLLKQKNFGNFFNVETFQLIILIYKRGNIVYHHWECTLFF